MKELSILIVEDGASQRKLLSDFLSGEGHEVCEAAGGEAGLQMLGSSYFDVVLLDYKMPGIDGLTVLAEARKSNPEVDVIMMTAHGTVDTAIQALKLGAADYITKPIELDEIVILLDRIGERRTLRRENELLREELREQGITSDRIIYQSRAMEEVVNLAGRVAVSDAAVLLEGESGTGKELIARLIHQLSPRCQRAMITVNCMALSESLLESELFGHERGAFTGATGRRIGRFEEADRGTLFLDEIGELAASVQVKLLRFLQDHEFQRVGGNRSLKANVRVVSATNRKLEELVKSGAFREDLYYRLNVVSVRTPPLRERKDDLPLLIEHFLRRFAQENHKPGASLSAEAHDLLLKYDYPGNVRELENIIERAVVIARGSTITRRDLPFHQDEEHQPERLRSAPGTLRSAVEELEREMIENALREAGSHQTRAAEQLGISERVLRYKLKKYGIDRTR
jgi:two-component system NtrC family response regulator